MQIEKFKNEWNLCNSRFYSSIFGKTSSEFFQKLQYEILLGTSGKNLEVICGHNEILYVKNTYQFTNYDRYEANGFSEETKRKYRDEHFSIDLQNAYELGKRLAS